MSAVEGAIQCASVCPRTHAAFQRAEVDWASKTGPAKELAKEEKDKMQKALADAGSELQAKTAQVAAVTKQVGGAVSAVCTAQEQIAGSGEMLGGRLEALSNLVMSRIMQVLEPNVRHLVTFGMRFIRGLLGLVAAAIIEALGSVPFVGGALAPIGQIVYDIALGFVEDGTVNGLLGVVERLLGQFTARGLDADLQSCSGQDPGAGARPFYAGLEPTVRGRRPPAQVQRASRVRRRSSET
jgi:hypothetical protein